MYSNEDYMLVKKADMVKIDMSQINEKLPDLKNSTESKPITIGKWLMAWIDKALAENKIEVNYILPSKAEFAYKLGVSIGTIQNTLKYVENMGYVEAKQCVGTIIKDRTKEKGNFRKLTSKKDLAVEAIKHYIKTDAFQVGENLPSIKTLSTIIGYSENTIRPALEYLASQNIICHKSYSMRNTSWYVLSLDFEINIDRVNKKTETLVDLCVKDLEEYIITNCKIGDKLPAHYDLVKILKTSMKTVHDAQRILSDKGIILSKRGTYGTTVIKMPNNTDEFSVKPETSIFASAEETAFYRYEKTQNYIRKMIAADYEIGDKIPSISELSKKLDLSENTIRKALHNLAHEGYLVFSRGRYGGTFVIDLPELDEPAFKWLAVSSKYAIQTEPQIN